MPGKKITDQQVRKYKEARRQATQQIAAARMGISVRSARRIEQADGLPSQRGPRTWRTRADPLADVWEQAGGAHQRSAGSATNAPESKPRKNARAALSDFARSQSPQASSGRITTERFSSPGL